ncbi:MAG: nitrite reductase (NAD(P)H) small subunit [Candidatus Omnitrophica bacterium]|nr:nitrite reductase (NAD(P)H) small subunit [Candidatus Omnitrophota bacterium]
MESFRFHLGNAYRIPCGQGQCFTIGIHEVAVIRSSDGHLFAIENRCPQGGALADGVVNEFKIACPLHDHSFDLHTGLGSTSGERVRRFKVWEENGNILLLFVFPEGMVSNHSR